MKKEPALSSHEERILRMTIDNPQVFDVPVRTVKRLLALLDLERVRGFVARDVSIDADTYVATATPVPELQFVKNPAHPDVFCMRAADGCLDGIYARAEAANLLRTHFDGRIFNVPRGAGVVPRPTSEIADMLERGDLP